MNTHNNEHKTALVVVITALTMVVEIFFGITTGSMALLADGIHMGSHVFAIGLSWLAYVLVRSLEKRKNFSGNSQKILTLSGYSSGLILLLFAFFILVEAVQRAINPQAIDYSDAILVAIIGLLVNVVSAFLLHHDHDHADHNIKAAYLHVLADALTSISAIVGLIIAREFNFPLIDPLVAILSSFIIIKWSVGLLKTTGKELIDIKEN